MNIERFVIIASNWSWGRGKDLAEAAKNANCLSTNKKRIKKGIKAFGYKVIVDSPLTEELIKRYKAAYGLKDYKPGDFCEPFVDNHGSVTVLGTGSVQELGEIKELEAV